LLGELFGEAPGVKRVLYVGDGPSSLGLGLDFNTPEPLADGGGPADSLGGAASQSSLARSLRVLQEKGWRIDALPYRGMDPAGLHYVAQETGGRVFQNAGGPGRAVAIYQRETSHQYVLAVQVDPDVVGGSFRVRVRAPTLPPRAAVYHRERFRHAEN
jgi:hypothetical protein